MPLPSTRWSSPSMSSGAIRWPPPRRDECNEMQDVDSQSEYQKEDTEEQSPTPSSVPSRVSGCVCAVVAPEGVGRPSRQAVMAEQRALSASPTTSWRDLSSSARQPRLPATSAFEQVPHPTLGTHVGAPLLDSGRGSPLCSSSTSEISRVEAAAANLRMKWRRVSGSMGGGGGEGEGEPAAPDSSPESPRAAAPPPSGWNLPLGRLAGAAGSAYAG